MTIEREAMAKLHDALMHLRGVGLIMSESDDDATGSTGSLIWQTAVAARKHLCVIEGHLRRSAQRAGEAPRAPKAAKAAPNLVALKGGSHD